MIRQLIPRAAGIPSLIDAHRITLLIVCPDLAGTLAVPSDLAAWLRLSREGNARSWTLRLAHGLTDFLLAFAAQTSVRTGVSIADSDEADPLDREFLSVLTRRADPEMLCVRLCAAPRNDCVDEPPLHADELTLAREYVASECTSRRADVKRAYSRLDDARRRELHRERFDTLRALSRDWDSLGAIPFHCEQAGSDPEPLLEASTRCMHLAYYEAALDWSIRGRAITVSETLDPRYTKFTRNLLYASLLLGRYAEVETICAEIAAQSADRTLLAGAAYAQAILNVRLYGPARRDPEAARGWVGKSLALTEQRPPSDKRVVNLAFLRNTLALIEMRAGRFEQASELLTAGLEFIAANAPGKFDEECVLLLHNRARLHTSLKRPDAAIADLTTLLRHQPGVSEAYLDRGILHRRAGRLDQALKDFDAAIAWSPPYPEAFLNRAEALAAMMRPDEALAAYGYVLTLKPDHVEALANRACLLFQCRRPAESRADVETAIRIDSAHPRLICLRGLLELEEGASERALESFTESIRLDPALADAWANRATVRFRRGDAEGAEGDLTKAITLREDAAALYNRGRVFESRAKWREAAQDYERALELGADERNIRTHLSRCHRLKNCQ